MLWTKCCIWQLNYSWIIREISPDEPLFVEHMNVGVNALVKKLRRNSIFTFWKYSLQVIKRKKGDQIQEDHDG